MHKDPQERIAADRVAAANYQGLIDVIREYSLFIRATDLPNWRPTLRLSGTIPGVAHSASVTILATDGVVAYFVFDGAEREHEVLFGHIQRFTNKVLPLFSVEKKSGTVGKHATARMVRTRVPTLRVAKLSEEQQMRALLAQLQTLPQGKR